VNRTDVEKLVRCWIQDAIAEGRFGVFDDLLASDVVDRSGPVPTVGVESFKMRAAAVRSAFADIQIAVDDLLVDGDAIVWRWTLTGTHVGSFAGLAPTGRRATLRGVNFQRLRGERVAEHWTLVHVFGTMQTLRS
jgi:predicted ester cyclase